MAGSVPRGSRGHGRSSRPGSSSLPVEAITAARPARTGARTSGAPTKTRPATTAAAHTPASPISPPTSPPATRAVYRLLLMKGMSPAEAANLTAFVCGLSTTDVRWSLKQVNQLLFLRAMRQAGRFDDVDGNAIRKRPG